MIGRKTSIKTLQVLHGSIEGICLRSRQTSADNSLRLYSEPSRSISDRVRIVDAEARPDTPSKSLIASSHDADQCLHHSGFCPLRALSLLRQMECDVQARRQKFWKLTNALQ